MSGDEHRHTFFQILRTTFGRGLVVLIPVVITVWVLNILFEAIDGTTSWIFRLVLNKHIPGLGFVTMIVLILLVGALSRNLIGRTVFKYFERLITSLPLARTIYSATRDLFKAFQSSAKGKSFRQVVIVEYPRQGIFTVGFVTNELSLQRDSVTDEVASVYIPNPPNPTSGMLVLVPRKQVQVLDVSVEDGLKLVLSGGIVTNSRLSTKLS
jgi:uncharacterized membrane protein